MLPVNTLRDLIRANQFFASSSLVVSIGAAGFATSTEGILHFKVLCIVSAQGVTFIIFLQAVRFYSHLEILINTETFDDGVPVTDELCYAFMNKASSFGAAGQKGLMITFPLLVSSHVGFDPVHWLPRLCSLPLRMPVLKSSRR